MRIFLHRNGHNFGPYSEKALAGFVKSGLIEDRIYAWKKDLSNWVPLSEILQLSEPSSSTLSLSNPGEEEAKVQIVCSEQLEWVIEYGSEINYYKGVPFTGISEDFFENGQKKFSQTYLNGKRDGIGTHWFENGQKQFEEHYIDGKKEGLFTTWFENGNKLYEENFKNDKRHGISKVWYDNGQEESETNYFNGEYHGVTKEWDEDGDLDCEIYYKHGKIVQD